MFLAGVAHPVERHLAKVEVASSSLVTRSIKKNRCFSIGSFLWKAEGPRLEPFNATVRWTVAGSRLDGNHSIMYRASSPAPEEAG